MNDYQFKLHGDGYVDLSPVVHRKIAHIKGEFEFKMYIYTSATLRNLKPIYS